MDDTVPQQGDLIWIDSEPHAGHEYGGHNSEGGIPSVQYW